VRETWRRQLEVGLETIHLALTESQSTKLLDYLELLVKWNKAFNLTAVRDPSAMVQRHLIDSLQVLPWVRGPKVLDVGSGAGLPGIPLAVVRPDFEFVLLDTNGKKTRFMNQARIALSLSNVTVVKARVEAFRPPAGFDTVISRAFSALDDFWRGTRHLLVPGGRLLAMKGPRPAGEVQALEQTSGVVPEVLELASGPGEGARTLVIWTADT